MDSGAELVAFVPATDLARAEQFYANVLGLERVEVSTYACVLRAGATTLRVTRVPELTPQPFTVLGWKVPDIRGALADLAVRGVRPLRYDGMVQDGSGIWTAPGGDLIAWFQDSEGNTLSMQQPAA